MEIGYVTQSIIEAAVIFDRHGRGLNWGNDMRELAAQVIRLHRQGDIDGLGAAIKAAQAALLSQGVRERSQVIGLLGDAWRLAQDLYPTKHGCKVKLLSMADLMAMPDVKEEVWTGPFSKDPWVKRKYSAWDVITWERLHAQETFAELRKAAPRGQKEPFKALETRAKQARTFKELGELRTQWLKMKGE